MKKRIISLLLAAVMVLNFAPVSAFAETEAEAQVDVEPQVEAEADTEEPLEEAYTPAEQDGVYLLDSEEALRWFAQEVNGGNGALKGRLTGDITLTGEWTPIGTENNPFSGSFDGDGYTISGLSINVELESDSDTVYLGLFGSVEGKSATNRAEICDLTVEGSVEVGDKNTATNQGGSYVGGIVGRALYADISGVVSKVEVNNAKDVSDSKTNATGGIVGDAYDVHFTNCGNEGSVYSANDYVGGITSGRVFTADGCYNSGAVSGVKRIGGIAGYTLYGTYSCEITNCYNTGMVIGDEYAGEYAGGIVGWMFYAYGAGDACTVENCYSTGWVCNAGKEGYSYNGTLVGRNNGGDTYKVINCYVTSEPAFGTNDSSAASAQVITDDELKELAATLGSAFKKDVGNVNDGFPVLVWQESICDHAETENAYVSNEDGTHTVTVTCVNCGEAQGEASSEDCADTDGDGKCDQCGYVFPAEADAGYLATLEFTQLSSAAKGTIYTLNPSFDPATHTYTLLLPVSVGNAYCWASLSDAAPEGSTMTLAWTNLYNNTAKSETVKAGSGSYMANFGRDGKTNTATVTAGVGEDTQTYTVKTVRTPELSALTVDAGHMDKSFDANTKAYTVDTTAETIVIQAEPYKEDYTVTYNGSESGEIALELGENVVTVAVSDGTYSETYTVTVQRHGFCMTGITATPENALICLVDSYGERILPGEDGSYAMVEGYEYTCTVTASGYVGQEMTFTAGNDMEDLVFTLEAAEENADLNTDIPAEWPNFRNGSNHLGITEAKTPYDPEDAELLWAVKYGTGWAAAPGSPILVDDCIVTYVSNTIKKLDKNTGKVVAENTMVEKSSYSIVPATYAEGMIFVGLSGGRIQAFNAETLESLWVYTDKLGGQPNCPITYQDGYIYAGFWNSETKDANFACISVTDENPDETTEAKLASWTYCRAGGFYWAGAYVSENGKYVVVGTDDGVSGSKTESASLLVFEAATGKLVDSWDGIRGDIRSNVSHDPQSDRVFFTSKGGVLCNAKIDWETGEISDTHITVIQDSKGNEYAMSTCTPSVYNGRIYIGVAGTSQFGASSGHGIAVYSLEEDGEMTQAYVYDILGYPQTSAMVSVGYVTDEDDSVYIYLPYNMTPGGISVLKDAPGQTAPIATTGEGYSEVFTPVSPLNQYCICSTIADSYGTIYYKNDSCYVMAISSKLVSLGVTEDLEYTYDSATNKLTVTQGSIFVTMKNGLTRDVSDYVTYDAEKGQIVYTYGFDSANYGLKELRYCFTHKGEKEIRYEQLPDQLGIKHQTTVVCAYCGAVTDTVTTACVDLDKNGLCDDCGAKLYSVGLKISIAGGFDEPVTWYPVNGTAEALSVNATSNYPNGTLSYQWYYSLEEDSYSSAIAVEGANDSTFTPDTGEETSMRFYFCEATLTIGENSWKVHCGQQPVIVCPQPTVTAYFSVTDDDQFVVGDNGTGENGGSGEAVAMKEYTVPYFDLALYGLEDFYFVSETYGENPDNPGLPGSSLTPGTAAYAFGKVTLLHLYIYALELDYCGLEPAEAGKGYLYDANLLGTEVLSISGSPGSFFMQEFWGHDLNLIYYQNYAYPLASEGWGSTADQILLEDGDIVTLSMYTSWSFFGDSKAGYLHLGLADDATVVETGVEIGQESLELTLYRSWNDMMGGGGTAHFVATDEIKVYCAAADDLPGGDVTRWTYVGTTDESGNLTADLSALNLKAGKTYIFAVAGQLGEENSGDIVSCAGGIRVRVADPGTGDVNGDGVLSLLDVLLLQQYVAKRVGADKLNVAAADLNGDGTISLQDVLLLQQRVAKQN